MHEIARRHPSLRLANLRALCEVIATERNAVALINLTYSDATWGLACLKCQVVKKKIEAIWNAKTYPWLEYVSEPGMAYTVIVGGVPLRVQPDVDEIRDVMPGERRAMKAIQPELFPGAVPAILRLEVTETPGKQVDRITLYLFNESTGAILDSAIIYAVDGSKIEPDPVPTVLTLARDAQSVDTSKVFEFLPDETIKKHNDGEP